MFFLERQSPIKRKVSLKYRSSDKCQKLNGGPLSNTQICVGEGNGTDSCFGDSGGPLMFVRKVGNGYANFVVGIVSYGFGTICGAFPGVYTYIPPYVNWINENIN